MLVSLDSDALQHLVARGAWRSVASRAKSLGVQFVAGIVLLEEVLVDGEPERRERHAEALLELLEPDHRVLDRVSGQMRFTSEQYRRDQEFSPVSAGLDTRSLLRDAALLPDRVRVELRSERERGRLGWERMHTAGREEFQRFMREHGFEPPSPSDWLASRIDSEMVHRVVGEMAEIEHDEVGRYLDWNPVCRTFVELLLLCIRRLGVLPENESSLRRDAQWNDIEHASLQALVDWFVTDDRRLRDRLLREHAESTSWPVDWRFGTLDDFLDEIRTRDDLRPGKSLVGLRSD